MSLDTLGRPLGSLRISVTDRCNIRCAYCMPEDRYVWLPKPSILTFEEIERLARAFMHLGVTKLRLTGGEPLLRRALPDLVRRLARLEPDDLAMTTNATVLSAQAKALKDAGLKRLTISLDTLQPDRFKSLTRTDRFPDTMQGIEAARATGFTGTKLNTVVMRGINDDEVGAILAFAKGRNLEARFIEYMDVGGATKWAPEIVVSRTEILDRIADRFGRAEALPATDPSAPADRFQLEDGTVFGVIASTTAPFCRTCDRSRLTADGMWYLCLYAEDGVNLRDALRDGASDDDLLGLIAHVWSQRADRGAEVRAGVDGRGALVQVEGLRADPHREMHTRGG
ncbi:MAG: GTP 3',8-cyclase MoaA [Gemmatimonadales bacterium]